MKNYWTLIFVLSFNLYAQETGENVGRLDPSLHQNYQQSECFIEFQSVYNKAAKAKANELKFKMNVAIQYGVVLNGSSGSSDWGKEEKSLVNAAHYMSTSTSMYTLNHFNEIYTKAQKKHPEITKEQTQMLIRKGFQSGKFCDSWFFSSRYGKNQVARYVKKEFGKYLEEEQGRQPAISDSEIPKEELEDEMNRELQYEDSDSSGSQAN